MRPLGRVSAVLVLIAILLSLTGNPATAAREVYIPDAAPSSPLPPAVDITIDRFPADGPAYKVAQRRGFRPFNPPRLAPAPPPPRFKSPAPRFNQPPPRYTTPRYSPPPSRPQIKPPAFRPSNPQFRTPLRPPLANQGLRSGPRTSTRITPPPITTYRYAKPGVTRPLRIVIRDPRTGQMRTTIFRPRPASLAGSGVRKIAARPPIARSGITRTARNPSIVKRTAVAGIAAPGKGLSGPPGNWRGVRQFARQRGTQYPGVRSARASAGTVGAGCALAMPAGHELPELETISAGRQLSLAGYHVAALDPRVLTDAAPEQPNARRAAESIQVAAIDCGGSGRRGGGKGESRISGAKFLVMGMGRGLTIGQWYSKRDKAGIAASVRDSPTDTLRRHGDVKTAIAHLKYKIAANAREAANENAPLSVQQRLHAIKVLDDSLTLEKVGYTIQARIKNDRRAFISADLKHGAVFVNAIYRGDSLPR